MPRLHLTDIGVRNLKAPETGQVTYWDTLLPAFGVRVSQGGARSFVLVQGDQRKRRTIGRYPQISLSDARSHAKHVLAEITLGTINLPSIAFQAAVEQFLSNSEIRNKPRTAKDYRRLLTRHFLPALGKKQIGEVTAQDLAKIIDRLFSTPSECAHAYAAIKIFFRWAIRRRMLPSNPTDGLQGPPKAIARQRVLF